MFSITEKAAKQIKKISDEEGIGYYSVRIKLAGGGCVGLIRSIEFEKNPRENDTIIEFNEIKVFIDEISSQYMSEAVMDYKNSLMETGFIFTDPNQTSSCGCKKSVGY
jgi:iron-sulfur cluster assembly accessory protein